jgi:hypothetical protein
MSEASFRSINFPDRFIRHINFLGEFTPVESDLDKHDATFTIVPGLADRQFISFKPINVAGQVLRHQDFRLKLSEEPGLFDPSVGPPPEWALLRADATFIMETDPNDATVVTFRSFNFPDRFIRHRDFHLFVEPIGSPFLMNDAIFRKEPPWIILPPLPPIH